MESNFMKDCVSKKMEAKAGEMMTISKRVYQNKIGRAYHIGAVDALMKIGKSVQEIAEILDMNQSTIRSIQNEMKK